MLLKLLLAQVFILVQVYSLCKSGQGGCAVCKNTLECQTCQQQFVMVVPGACTACKSPPHCIQCATDLLQCATCEPYYAVEKGLCVACKTPHCMKCQADLIKCDTCEENYFNEKGVCVNCKEPNCEICQKDPLKCKTCVDRYVSVEGVCVHCKQQHCLKCKEDLYQCQTCEPSYFNVATVCTACKASNCQECGKTIETCKTCDKEYYNIDGVCTACKAPHCKKCGDNPLDCQICDDLYYSEKGVCTPCKTGDHCLACNADLFTCKTCEDKYYNVEGICKACAAPNCQKCGDTYLTCQTCNKLFYNEKGVCAACRTGEHCLACNADLITCKTCEDKYFVLAGACSLCKVPNCKECNDSALVCKTCDEKFYNEKGVCLACKTNEHCLACNADLITCDRCQDTYFNTKGICLSCQIDNCVKCAQAYKCQTCQKGYTLKDGKCVLCQVVHCEGCNKINQCETCEIGYAKDNKECLYCDKNFVRQNNSTDSPCICPKKGFYLEDRKCKQFKCDLPFHADWNEDLKENYCACPNGSVKTGDTCKCLGNFTLVIDKCVSCNVTNCKQCLKADICTTCTDQYDLKVLTNKCQCKDGTKPSTIEGCVKCQIYGCSECSFENKCVTCLKNYELDTEKNQCIKCGLDNCLHCKVNNTCSECKQTFIVKEDGKCGCPPTHIRINDTCVCPQKTTEFQKICYLCTIPNCEVCDADQKCKTCTFPLIPTDLRVKCGCPKDMKFNQQTKDCECPYGQRVKVSTDEITGQKFEQCVACSKDCRSCDEEKCLTCNPSFTLKDGACTCTQEQTEHGGACQCNQGYYEFNNTCIHCSLDYCVECSAENTCTKCDPSFIISSSSTCVCKPGFIVSGNGVCVCPAGTTNIKDQKCVLCNISYCKQCQKDNICKTCQSPFVTNATGQCQCVKTFIQSGNTCICPPYSFLDTKKNQCISCVSNCDTCDNPTTCTKCIYPFVLNEQNTCICPYSLVQVTPGVCGCDKGKTAYQGVCYNCDVDFCSICSADNVCSTCANNLIQVNGTCKCPKNFELQNNICVCPQDFTLLNGQCFTCFVRNCSSCSADGFCATCNPPFLASSEGACICPPTFEFNGQKCVCASTYVESLNKTCVPCNISHCSKCLTPAVCSDCIDPFVFNAKTLKCGCQQNFVETDNNCTCNAPNYRYQDNCYTCNISNCLSCRSNNVCYECQATFVKVGTGCGCPENFSVVNGSCICPTCDCPSGQVRNITSNSCVPCPINNCGQCETISTCKKCDPTFIPVAGKTLCQCNSTTQIVVNGRCTCPTYYTPVNQTCYLCAIQYCTQCSTTNVCSACSSNFTLNSNKTACVCPTPFVVDTTTTPNSCVCPSQTTPFNNICINCTTENCQICSSANNCSVCVNNLTATNGTCGCSTPNMIIDNSFCICKPGFYQTVSGASVTCTQCNITNCATCSSSQTCTLCTLPFVLNSTNGCECAQSFQFKDGKCKCPTNTSQYNQKCVNCSVSNCQTCQQANNCTSCAKTFIIKDGNCQCPQNYLLYKKTDGSSICYECNVNAAMKNCLLCSSNNFCSTCQAGFVISSLGTCVCPTNYTIFNSTCVPCNVSNCNQCQTANVCQTCNGNYTLLSNVNFSYCLLCQIPHCNSCSLQNICTNCSGDYKISATSHCVKCQINNCLICSTSGTCALCSAGLQLSSTKDSCISCSITGCSSCNASNICYSCAAGFSLSSNNTCIPCLFPCKTCQNNDQTCSVCALPFSPTPNTNLTCYTCAVPNCISCQANNLYACTKCYAGYQPNLNNTACVPLCSTSFCTKCANGVCSACALGYYPIDNGCRMCPGAPACISCNGTGVNYNLCTGCASGYFLLNYECLQCSPNCAQCDLYGCKAYKKTSGLLPININGKVYPTRCDPGCSTCSNQQPTRCIQCLIGYTVTSDNTCLACQYPCRTCYANNTSTCLSCYNGTALLNGICQQCNTTSNCLTCSSNLTVCLTCPLTYALANGTCSIKCSEGCLQCTSNGSCFVCMQGYSANSSGVCLPCLSNCRSCSNNNYAICLTCGQGFYLNQNQTCQLCTPNCLTCSSTSCSICNLGYTLTQTFTCVPTCNPLCASCLSTDANSCTQCLAGYSLSGNICTPQRTCNGSCQVCAFGFYISNSTNCAPCSNTNCARCNATNPSICTSCQPGQYLSNSSCIQCPVGCKTCSNPQNCLTCSSGYTPQIQNIITSINCIACNFPCAQCVGNANTCTQCVDKYTFDGWKCITSFNFGFTITLTTTLQNFYANYQNFLNGLKQLGNVPSTTFVTINQILNGSVIVYGNISIPTSSNGNAITSEYDSISSGLSQGGQIAGMTIQTSSISVNGGTLPPDDNDDNNNNNSGNPNLAIILGLAIPLGLIIIGIIIYCIVIRKQKQNKQAIHELPSIDRNSARETFDLKETNSERKETLQ